MFWIALAAQLSAPQPLNRDEWFRPEEVPTDPAQLKKLSQVRIGLTINPAGAVQRCEVGISSGSVKLDRIACALPNARARFRPAFNARGEPAYGVYSINIKRIIADRSLSSPATTLPMIALRVNQLPKGVKDPAVVQVMFELNNAGRASAEACNEEAPEGLEPIPALAKIACNELAKTYRFFAVRDDAGRPVSSINNEIFLFSTKPLPPLSRWLP